MATRILILTYVAAALAPSWTPGAEPIANRPASTIRILAPEDEPLIPPPPKEAPLLLPGERQEGPDARDQVDLSIKSIRAARTAIAPPAAFDTQGNRRGDPPDWTQQLQTDTAIVYVSEYGPNWVNYSRYPDVWGYCHRPLYFEEINLERYGNSLGLVQPVVSGAHFFGKIPFLPYMATVEKPWVCSPPDPSYPPPGVSAPWQPGKRYPLRLDAAAVQAAATAGVILLFH